MEKQKKNSPQPPVTDPANEKTALNNQWTNNNTKYYPDNRPRKDGPGGEDKQ